MWPVPAPGGPRPPAQPAAVFAGSTTSFPPPWIPPAQTFNTMGLTPPVSPDWIADSGALFHTTPHAGILDWIADSGALFHTTPHAGILSSVRAPHPSCPSSIMVGNGSCLPVTSVGTASGPFCLPNVLVAPNIVHNLLSIRQFTFDNSCYVNFDPPGLL